MPYLSGEWAGKEEVVHSFRFLVAEDASWVVLQIPDAEATQGDWPRNALPIDVAVTSLGIGAPRPQESSLDLYQRLDCLLRWSQHEELVDGDRAQDGFDECEATGLVHEGCLPAREHAGGSVDDGL